MSNRIASSSFSCALSPLISPTNQSSRRLVATSAFSVALCAAVLFLSGASFGQITRPLVPVVTDQSVLNLSNNFGQPGNIVANAGGDVAFNDAQNSAVFLQKAGTSTPIRLFQSKDPVPGVSGALADYVVVRAINATGSVEFNMVYESATGLANQMILYDGTSVKLIADSSQLGANAIISGGSALLNDAGDVSFILNIQGVPAAIYVAPTGSSPVVVAAVGSAAPGGTLQSITPLGHPQQGSTIFNNNGEVVFVGTVNGNSGLYVASIKNGIRKVVAIGDSAPGGGTFTGFNGPRAAINNLGQVVFFAVTNPNSTQQRGIWVNDPTAGVTRQIASTATPPPVPGGGGYGAFSNVLCNDQGDVLFHIGIVNNATVSDAILRGEISGAAPTVVAYSGEAVAGGTFTSLMPPFSPTLPFSLNSTGTAVFLAQVSGTQGVQNAIYTQSGTNAPGLIALDGQASGDGSNFSLVGSRARILGDNSVAFTALETGGSAFAGIFHSSNGAFQKLVNSNDPLPAGANISLRNGTISSSGSFLPFLALNAGGSVNAFVVNTLTGVITKIATEGDLVPGLAGARLFAGQGALFGGGIYANASGAVALDANLAANGSKTAVLLWTAANGLVKLVADGDIDPVTGQAFVTPQTAASNSGDVSQSPINSQGTVLIATTLSGSNQQAVYRVAAGAAPAKVIATGDLINGFTVTDLTNGGNLAAPQLNASGQVAFNAVLSDGSDGVYLTTAGGLAKIVKQGDLAPNGIPFSTIPGFFSLNNSGEVAFFAGYGPLTNGVSSAGVFIGSATTAPQSVALDGAPAPSGGNFSIQAGSCVNLCFQNLPNDVLINDEHDVAFSAALSGASSDSGYFLRRAGTSLQAVALQGQPAPGTTFNFTTFTTPGGDPLDSGVPGYVFSLGPRGELAFQNLLPGQVLQAVVPDLVATFYYGLDNSLTKVVAPGDTAPGTNGGQITQTSFTPTVLADGSVDFWAVTPGGSTTADAIYVSENPVLTITADNQSTTYNGTVPTLTYTVSPNVTLDTPAICAGPTKDVGIYPINCSGASKAGYQIVYVAGTATISPAILTVTANNASMLVGGPLPTFTATYTGLVAGDILSGTPAFSTTATLSSPPGSYPITVTQGSLSNTDYTFQFVSGTLLVTATLPVGPQGTAPIPNGLTNWYRAEGNALDTQSGANGTLNNVGFTNGEVGQAFNFTGSSNITAPASVGSFGTNDFSVDFWFNTTQAENQGSPIGLLGNRTDCSDGNFFGVRLYTGTTLFVELDQDGGHTNYNSVQTPSAVNDGNWHHVAIVRQGTTLSLYLDGKLVGSGQSAGITNITGANPFVMGTDACTIGYNGALDEIHIFNRALAQIEVQSIFSAGTAGLTTLVGWWNFNEGTGTTTGDLSGNGNIGTLSGNVLPAWTTDVPPVAFYHPSSLSFDGVSSYVSVPNGATSSALNFDTQVSIAAWVKPAVVQSGTYGIISKPQTVNGTGWALRMEEQDPNFAINNGVVNCTVHATANPLSPGVWTHVVATYDSSTSTVQLYVNGTAVPVDNQGCQGPLVAAGAILQSLEIGQEFVGTASGREFPGEISDARVYNRVITASEVAALAGTVPPTAVTNCGTVITTSGAYLLANDLQNCPADGIDIQATNVTLSLNNHTITGQFLNNTNGITVGGPAAGISNVAVKGPGTLTNFGGGGLGTSGLSYSLINGVTITGNAQGVAINQTFEAGNVRSTHNVFSANTSTGNEFHGFTFNGGDQNTFTGNVSTNNGQTGFLLFDAQGNTLNGNTASGNGQQGILGVAPPNGPGGFGNLIENNQALNNSDFDLEDDNVPCANTWINNAFGTANQACVESSPVVTLIAKPPTVRYGQPALLSASVRNSSTGAPVTTGTITFTELGTNFFIGPLSLDSFGVVQVDTPILPVGVHTITATYNAAAGVPGISGQTTLTITPAVLTVTPDSQSMVYGGVLPTLTATITGFANGENASVVTGAPALSTSVAAFTPPGSYPILAALGTLASSNYAFAFSVGTLTVSPQASVTLPTTGSGGGVLLGGANTIDTYITPSGVAQDGWITSWQTEFQGSSAGLPAFVPAGVQLKIFRSTPTGFQVVAEGAIHDPRPILQQEIGPSYPNFTQAQSLTTFNEAPIPVLAGDLAGITIFSDPSSNLGFQYPLLAIPGGYSATENVLLGQTTGFSDPAFGTSPVVPPLSFNFFSKSASNPLSLMNNFFVTGDYSVGSTGTMRGTGNNGVATGTLSIPVAAQGAVNGIPDGADIMGAFLYWETLENTPVPSGSNGTFDGYSISGQQIGQDAQFTDAGINGTLRVYRTDVLAYFALVNGIRTAAGKHTVTLSDGGNALPFAEGATLVVIYRVMSPNFPLKSVVLYDGSAVTGNNNPLQVVQGFYDAAGIPGQAQARVTNIYDSNGTWATSTSTVPLLSGSQYGAMLTPGAYAGIVLSTLVNNSDQDGILDAWKTGPPAGDFHAGQPGYYDTKFGQWIPLPGAAHGQKDLFVQMDYMCSNVLANGTCDLSQPGERSELPVVNAQGQDPMLMLQQVYANHGVTLHLQIGNAIQAETCVDSPGQLCQFPNQPGVVDWKLGEEIVKVWPRNPIGCAGGGDCSPRFAYGAKDSYHYVLMGDSLAIPEWNTTWGTLTGIVVATNGSQTTATITTTDRGSGVLSCPARISITGALGNPGLNGVYDKPSCPDTKTMIVNAPTVSPWTYPNNNMAEPVLGVTSGTVNSISGFSDLGGSDSTVTLGLWETSPNQDMSKRVNVQVGTILHEIGHTLGLSHGGTYFDSAPNSYRPTIEANCKPNYQSVMNYMFQIDLLGPNHTLELSNQQLPTLNESVASAYSSFGSPTFSTSSWYVPASSNPAVTPATFHCDGTAIGASPQMFRVDGAVDGTSPLGWSNGQDINYDGQLNTQMRGYNDWANVDLRQVGATSGQFAEIADLLQFGNIGSPLNVGAGGNVTLGSGGNIILGSGGNVTLGSGGSATLSSGGTVALGSGGSVTLGSGGTVTLGSAGTITMGSGGNVILSSGGNVALGSSGGTITLGSGGTVALGPGSFTLGSGGTILLGSGGTVVLGAGGSFTLDSSGGTVVLGAGGNVILGSGGNVSLGSGGTVALGSGGSLALSGGGTVALGSGGTVTLGSGGNVILGSGGTVTLGSGGTVTLGSGGTVTLGSGGNVTLGSGGTVTLGSGGTVALGSGGNVTLGSGGNVVLGSGGNVTLGSGGTATLGSGGTISLGSGGTVTLGSGGNVTLGSAGTVALGSGGNVTLGSGGTITLGSGGTVTLGSGGSVSLASGGNIVLGAGGTYTGSAGDVITLGSGGNITLGSGGTIALGSGGNVILGSGGTITLGSGGNVTLGSGGTVTLGSGGTIALGSGGNVTLGSGGNVTLGSGGNVTLGSGGTVALGSGGNVTLGSGGNVTLGSGGNTILGSGGNVTLGSGGTIALGSGGNVTLGSGGTLALGSGGNVTLGSGGTIALGSGGNIALGSGGTIALGSGGVPTTNAEGGAALGSGGVVVSEIDYETANSVIRPPESPTVTPTISAAGSPIAIVNWNPPAFGVVSQYTIFRSVNGGAPMAIGTVTGNPPVTTFTDGNPPMGVIAYTISTGVTNPGTTAVLVSPPSVPALLSQTIAFAALPNAKVGDSVPVTATASSGLAVSFTTLGNCSLTGTLTNGIFVSPNTVTAGAPGTCTVTAAQTGNNVFAAAGGVSQTFAIGTSSGTRFSQSISFAPLGPHTYGDPNFTLLATTSSNLPVSYTVSGNCSVSGSTLHIGGAGSCSVTASQPGNANYSAASPVTQSFPIAKGVLTVTADSKSKILDSANPTLTASYSGFKNGDTLASSLTGTPSLSTTATTTSPVGSYTITASAGTLAANNYTFNFVNGTLKILYASTGTCDGAPGHTILPPIDSGGTSVYKQGRTVPVQFRVCDVNGVSIGTNGVVTSFLLTGVYNGTLSTEDETVDATNNDTSFRWDSSNLQWIFNLSTSNLSAGQTYIYTITLNDGTVVTGTTFAPPGTVSFQFGLR